MEQIFFDLEYKYNPLFKYGETDFNEKMPYQTCHIKYLNIAERIL